jgi:hypothetical protein
VIKSDSKFFAGVPEEDGLFQPWFEVLFLGFEEIRGVQYHQFEGEGIRLYKRFLVANPDQIELHSDYRFGVDLIRRGKHELPASKFETLRPRKKSPPPLPAPFLLTKKDVAVVYSPDLTSGEQIQELPICLPPALEERAKWKGLECYWVHEGVLLNSFRTQVVPDPNNAAHFLRLESPRLQKNFLKKTSLWNGEAEPRHFLRVQVVQTRAGDGDERDATYRLQIGKRRFGSMRRYFFGKYLVYAEGDPHLGYEIFAVSLASLNSEERKYMGFEDQ